MRNADRLEKALQGFKRFKESFHERAVAEAIYSETFINCEGDNAIRRPLIIYKGPVNAAAWRTQLDSWKSYVDIIHNRAPAHFPKGSEDLKLPEERKNVAAIKVYKNNATTSRIIPTRSIIRKLEFLLKEYGLANKRNYSAEQEAFCKRIKSDLLYFRENEHETFRLRAEGYYEVLVHLTFENGDEEKLRINELGLFITPATYGKIKITLPEDSKKLTRPSVYDHVSPIETVAPYVGTMYLEKDIINARKKLNITS
ncbi:TPA: hypothetical protein L3N15_004146 [Vibrio parahaemolyticus]|nr:hypothetical protein [Vibrio parahaemolyticus]